MAKAYILGMLKQDPVHGWVLKTVGIYPEMYPTGLPKAVFVPLVHQQPFEAPTYGEALAKALPHYRRLKSVFVEVKFLHG